MGFRHLDVGPGTGYFIAETNPVRVYPVLVGGGTPFFPQRKHRVNLELIESRTFNSKVVYLRYRVVR